MITSAILSLLYITGVASQAIQLSVKNTFFDEVKQNYLPMLFEHIVNGYVIGPQPFGNKWAAVNLTGSELSLPGNNQQMFTDNFKVTPPQNGASNFGLSLKKMIVLFQSNFTANILVAKTSGNIHAYLHDVEVDLDIEVDTQPGFQNELAPKIKINKVNLAIDKKKTFISITGGVVPWMLSFVESMLQSYLVDYIIKELESALYTTFQDDLNQLALKYLQTFQIGNELGFDFSLNEKPSTVDDRFLISLNGTFMHEDPQTKVKTYSHEAKEKLNQFEIKNPTNGDIAIALRPELIDSFFDVWYKSNLTISTSKIAPSLDMSCSGPIASRLPNMQWDTACKKQNYPVDIQLSLPTKPKPVWVTTNNTGGVSFDLHLKAVRTDTNKVLMDFILKDFEANLTMYQNEKKQIELFYFLFFHDAELIQRGQAVKDPRDIWQLSDLIDNGVNAAHDAVQGLDFRYVAGITMREIFLNLNGDSKALYFGITADEVFLGYDQHQGMGLI